MRVTTKDKLAQLRRARNTLTTLQARIDLALCGLESDDKENERQNAVDVDDAFDEVLREMLIATAFLNGA